MNILAVDMAFKNIGTAIFENNKLVMTHAMTTSKICAEKSDDDRNRRSNEILEMFEKILFFNQVDFIVAELATGCQSQSARSANMLGIAFGLLKAFACGRGIKLLYVTPLEAKEALTGNKRATKHDMMDAARKMYGYYPFPKQKGRMEHIADSIGVYEAYKRLKPYKEATGEW